MGEVGSHHASKPNEDDDNQLWLKHVPRILPFEGTLSQFGGQKLAAISNMISLLPNREA